MVAVAIHAVFEYRLVLAVRDIAGWLGLVKSDETGACARGGAGARTSGVVWSGAGLKRGDSRSRCAWSDGLSKVSACRENALRKFTYDSDVCLLGDSYGRGSSALTTGADAGNIYVGWVSTSSTSAGGRGRGDGDIAEDGRGGVHGSGRGD